MPLHELTSEPVFMTGEELSHLQESTPSSFSGHAPVLRLKLDDVRCSIQPEDAIRRGEASGSSHGLNGSASHSSVQQGTLWVTESNVSFLPPSGKGFSLDYPSLSLHAVSRTLPPSLEVMGAPTVPSPGCLYCQLEGVEGEDEDEDEPSSSLSELWILPADQDSLEPLFEALSYCASLHPSAMEDEDEGGGHPFAGVGPFGTGLAGQEEGGEDGAFEDADEDRDEADVHLSETGRATLAHLDALLQSPSESFPSADARNTQEGASTSLTPTNSLILVHLPDEVFTHPPLAASLLDLLHAFGNLASWTPLPSFGRALIVYEQIQGAVRAKEALDRLLLPLIEEGGADEGEAEPERTMPGEKCESRALRAYFGPSKEVTNREEGDDHLSVPTTDRNFLISPPGSPPVGWEPIKEDPPNRETLADDLIRALGSLRDKGLGVQGHQPRPLREKKTSERASLPPPSLVIEPSQATVRSRQAGLARLDDVEQAKETISIPGVVVQSMDQDDGDDGDDDDPHHRRINKGLSISSVKATVESMQRITPTGRPPLA